MFLLLIPASTLAGKYGGGPVAQGAVLVVAFSALFVTYAAKSPRQGLIGRGPIRLLSAGLAGVAISALVNVGPKGIVQSALIITAFATIYFTAPRLSENHLRKAFLAYAIGASLLFVATLGSWNPNALAVNFSFIGILFICGAFKTTGRAARALYGVAFGASLLGNILLESRTATVALIASIFSWWLIRVVKPSRAIIIGLVFALIAILLVVIQGGGRLLQDLAKSHLDNTNPIAVFFLKDKNFDRVDSDMFDRRAYWDAAIEVMKKNPLIGIGYGEALPQAYLFEGKEGMRAHNAYLEIGYQTGVLVLILWVVFYFSIYMFFAMRIARGDSRAINVVGFLSISYLILAGVMESSGLLSLSVSGHWICIICFFYCLSREYHGTPTKRLNRQARALVAVTTGG